MANPQHLKILRQGVDVWNDWRTREPSIAPELSDADLSDAFLGEADLVQATLGGAKLIRANLAEANLAQANLNGADLTEGKSARGGPLGV